MIDGWTDSFAVLPCTLLRQPRGNEKATQGGMGKRERIRITIREGEGKWGAGCTSDDRCGDKH